MTAPRSQNPYAAPQNATEPGADHVADDVVGLLLLYRRALPAFGAVFIMGALLSMVGSLAWADGAAIAAARRNPALRDEMAFAAAAMVAGGILGLPLGVLICRRNVIAVYFGLATLYLTIVVLLRFAALSFFSQFGVAVIDRRPGVVGLVGPIALLIGLIALGHLALHTAAQLRRLGVPLDADPERHDVNDVTDAATRE